jgi:hypothetical protein
MMIAGPKFGEALIYQLASFVENELKLDLDKKEGK